MTRSGSVREQSGPRAGFMLIEALAALTIAVVAFAVIAQFASSAFHNWSRGRAGAAVLDMITTGLAQLDRDLRQALPVPSKRAPGAGVLFRGEPELLQFASATGLRPGDLGVEVISVRALADRGGTALVRRRSPLSAGLEATGGDPVVLMQGRLTVRFAFRDAQGKSWPTWIDRPTLPSAVEIELLHADGTRLFGAPQILVLPSSYSADCLDPDLDRIGGKERCATVAKDAAARTAPKEPNL